MKHPLDQTIRFRSTSTARYSSIMYALMLLLCLLTTSCSQSVTASQEIEASTATLEWLDQKYGVVKDPGLQRLLRKITSRLSSSLSGQATAPVFSLGDDSLPARESIGYQAYPWHVMVINSDAPNAFSLGAGLIVITRAMIRETRTEAELASIIAHEMAHQLLGHTQAALSESLTSREAPHAVFSLKDEVDADRVGLKLLDVGRYDLRHAVFALSIGYRGLETKVSDSNPQWLHARLARMHQELAAYPEGFPATTSSREFNKIRRRF